MKNFFLLLLGLSFLVSFIPVSNVCASTRETTNSASKLLYNTHVQNIGWQDYVSDGIMSGTQGKGLRLEGMKIRSNIENVGVEYKTHVQNIGWQEFVTDGELSGTEGLSYRLEAIQIKLTGSDANLYDVYYQVHAQNMGWLGWAKNGENAGTAGYGFRLEGVKILLLNKGDTPEIGDIDQADAFYENPLALYSQIVEEYCIAESSGYSHEVIKNLGNVNMELYSSSYKKELYYLLMDISNDSIPELFISMYDPKYKTIVNPTGYQIYDMYTLVNGKPVRIFDVYTMGYRAVYTLCDDNFIKCYGSGGALNTVYQLYEFNGQEVKLSQQIEYNGWNGNKYYLTDATNSKLLITKKRTDEIIESWKPRQDLNWIKL
ncbi:MAG: hypothetical protein PHO29_08225 [Acetobacterium sp.]|nr:hypothetical protein [Acetobacterium sp.]